MGKGERYRLSPKTEKRLQTCSLFIITYFKSISKNLA